MTSNYTSTYLCINGTDVYFDTLIVKTGNTSFVYAAWGDGAHVNKVATIGYLTGDHLLAADIAYHIGELKPAIESADEIIAIRDHKVVYKREG